MKEPKVDPTLKKAIIVTPDDVVAEIRKKHFFVQRWAAYGWIVIYLALLTWAFWATSRAAHYRQLFNAGAQLFSERAQRDDAELNSCEQSLNGCLSNLREPAGSTAETDALSLRLNVCESRLERTSSVLGRCQQVVNIFTHHDQR